MIIGISGYSGAGKDEVGKIIQSIAPEDNWKIKKFATALKECASIITGIPIEYFEDENFKNSNLGPEWNTLEYLYKYNIEPTEDSIPLEITSVQKSMSVRELLQKLGTDAIRNKFHTNTWINALMNHYKKTPVDVLIGDEYHLEEVYPNWIITDTRFINEAIAIKNAGGIIIRVDRPWVLPKNGHVSETELDNWNFDYKIANVSDIISLTETVKVILKTIRI